MSWTTPPDFVTGAVVTEAQLDILSDDLTHLGGLMYNGAALSALATATALGAGTINGRNASNSLNFSSSTYAQVGTTNFNLLGTSIYVANAILIVAWAQMSHAGGGNGKIKIAQTAGGGTLATLESALLPSGSSRCQTLIGMVTGHAAGALQTFELQAATDGTGTLTVTSRHIIALAI